MIENSLVVGNFWPYIPMVDELFRPEKQRIEFNPWYAMCWTRYEATDKKAIVEKLSAKQIQAAHMVSPKITTNINEVYHQL